MARCYNWFRRNGDYEIISRKFEYYNMNYDVSVAWSMTPWTVEDYDEAREIFGNNAAIPCLFISLPDK